MELSTIDYNFITTFFYNIFIIILIKKSHVEK